MGRPFLSVSVPAAFATRQDCCAGAYVAEIWFATAARHRGPFCQVYVCLLWVGGAPCTAFTPLLQAKTFVSGSTYMPGLLIDHQARKVQAQLTPMP